MDNNISKNPQTGGDVEYIKIENTNYKINYHYDGEVSFMELIKNALKRDIETVLRQTNNT
jgi:Fe-S cluster biogenesis protein NfuA